MHLQLRTDLVAHIAGCPRRGGQAQPGSQAADSCSLEGSETEYVVLPSSDGEYDDTYLDEKFVPGQNQDGAFDYYRE